MHMLAVAKKICCAALYDRIYCCWLAVCMALWLTVQRSPVYLEVCGGA